MQRHRLQQGVQFIVATPGRLHDLLNRKDINVSERGKARCHSTWVLVDTLTQLHGGVAQVELSQLCMVVVDEMDTLLSLGMVKQVSQ